VAQAHDLALGGLGGDLQVLREGRALDEERMVAGRRETLGKAVEQSVFLCLMGEVLPCISLPARTTLPPKYWPDRLVAEADPEDGPAPGEGLDDVERDAGLARRARARRKEDAVGIQRQGLLGVISLLRNTRCSTPSWPKYWTRL
jgi:hypothetical protein